MKKLQTTKGFTLIELVVVIVILGILAATAAPKFIDLTGDAKASIVEGVRGSLNSAADMAHAKALVAGQTGSTGEITVGGVSYAMAYGWPTNTSIASLIEFDSDITSGTSGTVRTFTHADATTPAGCLAYYDNSVSNTETRPTIADTTSAGGC